MSEEERDRPLEEETPEPEPETEETPGEDPEGESGDEPEEVLQETSGPDSADEPAHAAGEGPEGEPADVSGEPADGENGDEPEGDGAGEEEEVPGRAKAGKGAVEAMLFASSAPVTARLLASTLGKRVKESKVKEWLRELASDYEEGGRAFALVEVAGGFRILTRPEYHDFIRRLMKSEKSNRLSEAALDTLSVVAYKQPILKADVNQIRGVESGPILKALAEKGLIRAVGRAETLGRPILYGTSRKFLEFFGLKSLKDLPKLEK